MEERVAQTSKPKQTIHDKDDAYDACMKWEEIMEKIEVTKWGLNQDMDSMARTASCCFPISLLAYHCLPLLT